MIMRTIAARVVGVAVTTSLALGTARAAEPARPRVDIEVDVVSTMPQRDSVTKWTRDGAAAALRKGDVQQTNANATHRVEVEVGGTTFSYTLRVTVLEGSHVVHQAKAPVSCECTDDEFVAAVEREVAAVLPSIEQKSSVPAATAGAEPRSTTSAGPGPAPVDDAPPDAAAGKGRAHSEKIAGATLVAVGLAGLGGGIALLALGKRPGEIAANPISRHVRDYRPPGGALLGVAVLAAAAGVALLVVSSRRTKRENRAAMVPILDRGGAGLSLVGRF